MMLQKELLKNIKPNVKKAVFFAKRQLSELVCDAVNLEGINYTLPEVQTLLEGITVGGHKISDQTITLNQAQAWTWLFHQVTENAFSLSKEFVFELHSLAAKEEALEWGCFRAGQVTISGTTYTQPEANTLESNWIEMIKHLNSIENIVEKAILLFLYMSRNQFFYDVNKRTARFMMNGFLLSYGYPVINVPAKRSVEFNTKMLKFYESFNPSEMIDFMISCYSRAILEIMAE